ncbi:MAG: NADH-quinone oxidoreductase subunit C [Chloroflexi bacterium]|nr:NADH-quinone oxidoreductase subunit C [Chloroflexota bacterium]
MTRAFQGEELARFIQRRFPDAELEWDGDSLWIEPQRVREVARFLKEEPQLEFNFLNAVSAVDYIEYFEVLYHLTSFEHNHSAVVKTRVYGRENPSVPSVVEVWPGADFQEREVWDLMGVAFEGHPNLKRIMLWEGFPGHPLRRDFEDVIEY